jgi:hypothetical protein
MTRIFAHDMVQPDLATHLLAQEAVGQCGRTVAKARSKIAYILRFCRAVHLVHHLKLGKQKTGIGDVPSHCC